jgi:hypothetical protein
MFRHSWARRREAAAIVQVPSSPFQVSALSITRVHHLCLLLLDSEVRVHCSTGGLALCDLSITVLVSMYDRHLI